MIVAYLHARVRERGLRDPPSSQDCGERESEREREVHTLALVDIYIYICVCVCACVCVLVCVCVSGDYARAGSVAAIEDHFLRVSR